MQVFKLPTFENAGQAMTKKLLVFVAKDVRGFTKRFLVAGVASTKQLSPDDGKYCKSCKKKTSSR